MSNPSAAGRSFRDYVGVVQRRWPVLVIVTLLVTVAVTANGLRRHPGYDATATVIVGRANIAASLTGAGTVAQLDPGRLSTLDIQLAQTRSVVRKAMKLAHLHATQLQFLRAGTLATSPGGDFVQVSFHSSSRATAIATANAWARATAGAARAVNLAFVVPALSQVRQRIAELRGNGGTGASDLYTALVDKQQQLVTIDVLIRTASNIVSPATSAVTPGRSLKKSVEHGIELGLLLGLLALYAVDGVARRVRDPRDAAAGLDLPLLAEVSAPAGAPIVVGATAPAAEPFRLVRASLELGEGGPARVVAIVPILRDGTGTFVAVNLAAALARSRRRVTIVDLDLRHPLVAPSLGACGSVGINDVLLSRATLDEATATVPIGSDGAGPAPVVQLLASSAELTADVLAVGDLDRYIRELSAQADVVLLAVPPVSDAADALAALRGAESVIVALGLPADRRLLSSASRVVELFRGRVLGLVTVTGDLDVDHIAPAEAAVVAEPAAAHDDARGPRSVRR